MTKEQRDAITKQLEMIRTYAWTCTVRAGWVSDEVSRLPLRPDYSTKAESQLEVVGDALMHALAVVRAAQIVYGCKPVITSKIINLKEYSNAGI